MLKKILLVFLAIVLAFVVIVSLRPSTFEVTRSATVPAAPPVAFEAVNDFRNWDAWSPWAKLDPTMTSTYSDPARGQGAVYEWEGNSEVGKGRMTIRQSHPHEHIEIFLEFFEPFSSVSDTDFRFAAVPAGTEVTWTMSGSMGFAEKAIGLFMDMEDMIGKDFEKGLAQLGDAVREMQAEADMSVQSGAPGQPAEPR